MRISRLRRGGDLAHDLEQRAQLRARIGEGGRVAADGEVEDAHVGGFVERGAQHLGSDLEGILGARVEPMQAVAKRLGLPLRDVEARRGEGDRHRRELVAVARARGHGVATPELVEAVERAEAEIELRGGEGVAPEPAHVALQHLAQHEVAGRGQVVDAQIHMALEQLSLEGQHALANPLVRLAARPVAVDPLAR